jgi:hypothetical protein
MKATTKTVLAVLALGTSAWIITAQDNGNQPPRGDRPPRHARPDGPGAGDQGPGVPGGPGGQGVEGRRPPLLPIIAALDANKDGIIDEAEIANAPAALRTLDKNGDGKLTMDELLPPRPPRGPGFGPPRGQRPPEGNGQQGPPPEN